MRMEAGVLGVVAVLAVASCAGDGTGWTPVLESTMPGFLGEELGAVTEAIRSAREEVRTDPDAAESELEEAERRVRGLARVYLPLYGAKVEAANAYRHHALGDVGTAREELDRVDAAIAAVSRETGGGLEAELEQVSSEVARARVALEGGSPEAGTHLRRLAEVLSDLVTRAGLFL